MVMLDRSLRYIDSDGHILEHPTEMLEFAPASYRDRIWQLEVDNNGREWVVYNGNRRPATGLGHWKPFFDAVVEEEMVMCLHIGGGFGAIQNAPDAPIDNLIILATQVSALAAQDLLWSPAFKRYPTLKVAWSEAGIGWIPFHLERCDRHYTNRQWLGHDFGDKLPSDIFREHSLACYVTDPSALKIRNDIGVDIIAWECDYPHSDSVWPNAPEFVHQELMAAGCPNEDVQKITVLRWTPLWRVAEMAASAGTRVRRRGIWCLLPHSPTS